MKQLSARRLVSLTTILLLAIGLSFYAITAISQDRKLPEPESIGVFYFLDSINNSLSPMERQVAVSKKRGMIKEQALVQVTGEKSTFRLNSDQKMEFVVNLPNGIDPNNYHLYLFSVKQGKRELILAESTMTGYKSNFVQVPCNITKFGAAYKYSPSQALTAGEYGFFPKGSNDAFCFGIDAAKKEGNKQPD
jgi:hypothetical protein